MYLRFHQDLRHIKLNNSKGEGAGRRITLGELVKWGYGEGERGSKITQICVT